MRKSNAKPHNWEVNMRKIKRTLCLFLIFACFLGIAQARMMADEIEGSWSARVMDGKIRMRLTVFKDDDSWGEWNSSRTIDRNDFTGLSYGKDQRFELKRDAGDILFEGNLENSRGYGSFSYTPKKEFKSFLQRKGFGKIKDMDMLHLSLFDINRKYIQDLNNLGYLEISTSKLVSLAVHGVSIDYIKEVHALGFRDISISKLLSFRIHGVKTEFIEALRDMGYSDLSPSELLELRIHGVTIDYIKEVQSHGLKNISLSRLTEFRIHGVKPEFIKGDWIQEGAVVIDAGYHPEKVGDIELSKVMDTCSAYTPVPGGVGPMTIATLIAQTVEAAEKAL